MSAVGVGSVAATVAVLVPAAVRVEQAASRMSEAVEAAGWASREVGELVVSAVAAAVTAEVVDMALSAVAAAAGVVTAALALAASAPAAEQVAEGMAGAGAGAEAVGAVRSAVGRGVAATAMWEPAVAEEEELRTL